MNSKLVRNVGLLCLGIQVFGMQGMHYAMGPIEVDSDAFYGALNEKSISLLGRSPEALVLNTVNSALYMGFSVGLTDLNGKIVKKIYPNNVALLSELQAVTASDVQKAHWNSHIARNRGYVITDRDHEYTAPSMSRFDNQNHYAQQKVELDRTIQSFLEQDNKKF